MTRDHQLTTLREVAALSSAPNEHVELLVREGRLPFRGAGAEARVPSR